MKFDSIGWLSTSQCNSNGSSNGHYNFKKHRWEANVYPNGKKPLHYHSRNQSKVSAWLEKQRLAFQLN